MIHTSALRLLALAALLAGFSSCVSPWHRLHEGEGWTLYVQDAREVEIASYELAFEIGLDTVEEHFGPFEKHVRVFAWDGSVRMNDGTRGVIERGTGNVENVPGIGPARVPAFHARGSDLFGDRSGVFLSKPDVGTAVHELVHAHLAESSTEYPLWFEEGLAMTLGDGAMYEGRWQVDGLACWPMRELSEEKLNDAQLHLLTNLRPGDRHDMRTNVLVHFVGWAIVFDLYRETGSLNWQEWGQRYANGISAKEVRERMDRTLHYSCAREWLQRLNDPDPAVRLACCRATWKLHSRDVATLLSNALVDEEDPDVAASLAVNLLATAAETSIGRRNRMRMWFSGGRVLQTPQVADPIERRALRTLYEHQRSGRRSRDTQSALRKPGTIPGGVTYEARLDLTPFDPGSECCGTRIGRRGAILFALKVPLAPL